MSQGRFKLDVREEFLYEESAYALEKAAQETGVVTIPGGIQEMCRCSPKGCSLAMGRSSVR